MAIPICGGRVYPTKQAVFGPEAGACLGYAKNRNKGSVWQGAEQNEQKRQWGEMRLERSSRDR